MKKTAKLFWVDLEMTGLDPAEDRILEIGAIATDWDFKELALYEGVVKVDDGRIHSRMIDGPATAFWQANPKARDGLIEQNKTGKTVQEIEDEILKFIDESFEEDVPVLLAGNSIHQDRRFIRNEWPRLEKRLHYRMLDVSSWKVVMEGKYRKKFAKPEEHRALEDIRGSIAELQYYIAKSGFKKAS